MSKTLTILEVSQKQRYIFASNKLRDNVERSNIIRYATDSAFFEAAAHGLYSEKENLVYSGGGHTVLQFESKEQAVAFSRAVTETALRQFPDLELFVKLNPWDEKLAPGENLLELTRALERKKSRRKNAFRRRSFGIEKPDADSFVPVPMGESVEPPDVPPLDPPAGFSFPKEFEQIASCVVDGTEDNFLAVVHIDGNAMGKRVATVYEKYQSSWEDCRQGLHRFSDGIQTDFEAAFFEMAEAVAAQLDEGRVLPLRPIILAGDDVCFVTAGRLGVECARLFLERLAERRNEEDGRAYSACAGIAIVHQKYPFHRASDLAEELCSSAKKFGAEHDPEGRISAMDWHLEFGELKDSLSDLRRDYETDDGGRLELRPLAVVVPPGVKAPSPFRCYPYFKGMFEGIRDKSIGVPRSKLKGLREVMKQGEIETDFYIRDQQIEEILLSPIAAQVVDGSGFVNALRENKERHSFAVLEEKGKDGKSKQVIRCLFFDAIEISDHYLPFKEVER